MTEIHLHAGAVLNLHCNGLTPAALEAAVTTALAPLLERQTQMATAIEDLVREVEETRSVTDSAIALIQGLKAQLDAAIAANDMSAVRAAVDALDAKQAELAAAITANTPAAPSA
jgi:hypothetical protein